MTFKKISLLLNFYHQLRPTFRPYQSMYQTIHDCARQLSLWLVMEERQQDTNLPMAQGAYTKIIKLLNESDSGVYCSISSYFAIAAAKGYSDIVSDMIMQGANVATHGPLALCRAAECGNTKIVAILCKENLGIDLSNPLYFKHEDVVRIFVQHGMLQAKDFLTILFYAIEDGNPGLTAFLLSHNLELNQQNESGELPLTLAAKLGHAAIVRGLIKAGAAPNLSNKSGVTPLVYASMHNHIETVHILLQTLAKPIHPEDIANALSQASLKGYVGVVNALLEAGADPNMENQDGHPLLYNVVMHRYLKVVKLLLKKGANPNKACPTSFTPLMEAAGLGELEIVKALLASGADVNAMNKYESTAIFWAAEKGLYDIVLTLIQAGASLLLVNIGNSETPHLGESPHSLALLNGHERVAELIERGMVRQAFWELKHLADTSEVRRKIAIHQVHGITKGQIVDYLINMKCPPAEKLAILQEAMAINSENQPANPLSLYMHIPQGLGFKRFFSPEATHAVSRIKAKINSLELLTPVESSGQLRIT